MTEAVHRIRLVAIVSALALLAGACGFERSWTAGGSDPSGTFTGGTELMNFAGHGGRLYAATSTWKDVPGGDPAPGPQVLVLDGPAGQWREDVGFGEDLVPGINRFQRINALKEVTFRTDGNGAPLPTPVSMLLAAPTDLSGNVTVFSRDDTTGRWIEMNLGSAGRGNVRSFALHRDTVTGVDRVFAGALADSGQSNAGLVSGVYDPTVAGRIRWAITPEFSAYSNRPMAFADVGSQLHVLIKPWVYRRVDGPTPTWMPVYRNAQAADPNLCDGSCSGLRGATEVTNPSGGKSLLVGVEGLAGRIVRLDPSDGYRETVELDLNAFLLAQWGSRAGIYTISAYNDMPEVVDPRTCEKVRLIGLQARSPKPDEAASTFYLVRHADARYELRRIPYLASPFPVSKAKLVANRAIAVSPFATDAGRVVYFGGYDANNIDAHNTAWIYRAPVEVVIDGLPAAQ